MSAPDATRFDCKGAPEARAWKGRIAFYIFLIQMAMPVCVDAFVVDGTVDNSILDPKLRSLRLPVVRESPAGCLPPGKGFQGENHCWYLLKGPHQYNVGALLASNNSGYTGYATLEMAVILASNSSPVDVGIRAGGRTILLFNLPDGISVGVDFFVPTFSKTGGYNFFTGKLLRFPIRLRTRVTVPGVGTVRAEGWDLADGFVNMGVDSLEHWSFDAFVAIGLYVGAKHIFFRFPYGGYF
ncbi:hypothetical protein FOZ61_006695 [Perkinsus olseni]|uniref:Uncharacterized protein n=1 Tax=Perkinsus olseni TaxID=32597 RepID=A0A7J6M9M9_PEROL|nr:hypothetical protein FOZ61_006695 [Perkinsus olseni]KAF4673090.1 hypothetical protein FOL46_007796 [Perkinsus olseni]